LKLVTYALFSRNGIKQPFGSSLTTGRTWYHMNSCRFMSFTRASGFNMGNMDTFFEILEKEYYPGRRRNGIVGLQSRVVEIITREDRRQIASLTSAEMGS
jgi:hypothetical protein